MKLQCVFEYEDTIYSEVSADDTLSLMKITKIIFNMTSANVVDCHTCSLNILTSGGGKRCQSLLYLFCGMDCFDNHIYRCYQD
jgi:hypothetical protein